MKSFIQYISEVATTPYKVRKRHGIKKHVWNGPENKWLHGERAHHTTYHFPHPDGERHISVKFEGTHKGDSKEPRRQHVSWGVHDHEPVSEKGKSMHAGRMEIQRENTKPHHAAEIVSKVHSIMKHHMKHTKAEELHWTSQKLDSESDRDHHEPGKLGQRTRIYKRQVKRSLKNHPDWHYSDDSHHSVGHPNAETNHKLIRKKK
jgi:hypothetical protein